MDSLFHRQIKCGGELCILSEEFTDDHFFVIAHRLMGLHPLEGFKCGIGVGLNQIQHGLGINPTGGCLGLALGLKRIECVRVRLKKVFFVLVPTTVPAWLVPGSRTFVRILLHQGETTIGSAKRKTTQSTGSTSLSQPVFEVIPIDFPKVGDHPATVLCCFGGCAQRLL